MANQETSLPAKVSSRATHLAGAYYTRFTLAQRVEHIVLLVSFTLLALTGLPQKYAGTPVGEWMIQAFGGIEPIRVVHHASAIVLVLVSIYHLLVLTYKTFVLHLDLTMLPGMKDVTDAIGTLRVNIGLAKERPAMPRYSYDEKVEYWAMVWGTVVMALTGFMLWNPILVTKFLPGQFIPAAKAAHGGEAVLAVLAILVWHLYSVHIKLFNKSMFTGRMTEHEMAEEHGHELAQIKAGNLRPRPSPDVIRRRTRKVMPIAAVITLLAVGFVYWLANAEQTAIATVPPPPPAERNVFVPLPPTLVPAASGQIGKAIPHPVAGREQCDSCHGEKGVKPYPADHAGRPNVSCQVCHQTAGTGSGAAPVASGANTTLVAVAIPHPVQGREDCLMCHKDGGIKPVPADHAGRTNDTCQGCHQISAGISGTPQAAATPETASGPAAAAPAGPKPIPHDLAGREQCNTCHGPTGVKPYPADHQGRSNDTCTTCHKAASAGAAAPREGTGPSATPVAASRSGSATPETVNTSSSATPEAAKASAPAGPKPIPHDLAGREQCDTCHGPTGLKPYPADHQGRANDTCTACHKAAAAGGSGSTTPSATGSAPSAAAAGAAAAIRHPIAGFEKCDTCHGSNGTWSYPADHAGRSNDICQGCHKPQS